MKFFEVFNLKTDNELYNSFAYSEVNAINKVLNGGYIRVTITSPDIISNAHISLMEDVIKNQVLQGMIRVKIENNVSRPDAFYSDPYSDYEFADACEGIPAASGTGNSSAIQNSKTATKAQNNSFSSNKNTASDTGKKFTPRRKGPDEGMIYGRQFDEPTIPLSEIELMRNAVVGGEIFEKELTETRKGTKILKFSISDYTDSISLKMFIKEGEEEVVDQLKEGLNIVVKGDVIFDSFDRDTIVYPVTAIKEAKRSYREGRNDLSEEKRVELHLHTRYSDMDALTNVEDMMDQVIRWGHRAVAITDHGVVQGFTDAFHKIQKVKGKKPELDFKVLYGCEGYLVDDTDMPVVRSDDEDVELIRRSAIPEANIKEPDPYLDEAISRVKKTKYHHIVILAANEVGRTNLYRLISLSHVNYFNKRPRIPKSLLNRYREGLILGSACVMGELYDAALAGASDEKLDEIARYYDYLEIQPLGNNEFLIREYNKPNHKGHACKDFEEIKEFNRKIIEIGNRVGRKVVATGDVHFLNPSDSVLRSIVEDSMKYADADFQGPFYLHTTDEMLAEFDYLGETKAREVVITNTNLVADQIEYIEPVRPDKCPPVIENSDQTLRDSCYETARSMYGDNIPEIVISRLEKELKSIISNGYSVMYIIARELVLKSVSDGYLVGSRGSVGSSFVATMSGITEVNPLPPHYRCPKCKYSDFDSPEIKEFAGGAGCDMPDKYCPECGELMLKDGFDIPFETFLGFKGDKEPDIDLNFSGEYQSNAHDYTEVIFGKGHTFRAGTIGGIQDKTAYGYVKGYMDRRSRPIRNCEINRQIKGIVGLKRSTGQHPGGIVVLPHGEEIYSFTPVQHPANDASKNIVTTHFDYHSIDHNLLKLDILGHDDPTMIRMLEDITGFSAQNVKLDDQSVMSLFDNTSALGVSPEDIGGVQTGTLGIPEFGTDFVIGMLLQTKPKNFSDLVRIAGLSHGTDVWLSNAETLIKEGKATLSSCICTRDDIMTYLINKGVDPAMSFSIMENVRKGKVAAGKCDKWPEWEEAMKAQDVPDWYLWSCTKIQYMFPKAHAVAYVMMAYRIAYYKIFYPQAYYAAFFSIRASSFDYELMCQGKEVLLDNMARIKAKVDAGEASPKDNDLLKYMYNCLEMYARGIEFLPIDIYEAQATRFRVIGDKIMPSFSSIDGMGERAAAMLEEEAKKGKFVSREDLKIRTKMSSTMADKLFSMGLLGNMPESSQMSIMDFFKI